MIQLVFVLCALLSFRFQSHLETVLSSFRFRVVVTIRNRGRLSNLKPTVPTRSSIKSHKNGLNLRKLQLKDRPIICLSLLCFWLLESRFSQKPIATLLILNFFHQRATRRDVISGRLKLTSQRQFAWCGSGYGVSRVTRWEGSFDRQHQTNLTRQNITRAAALFTQLKWRTEQSSSNNFLLGKRHFTLNFKTS